MNTAAESASEPADLWVESLDLDAQGVARRANGKVVFIEGALPFERVTVQVHRHKNQWEQGTLAELLQPSSQRVKPSCPHFGLHAGACGGCKMQHLNAPSQLAVKQRALEDNLAHIGKVRPTQILRPLHGPDWAYRFRARMSVRYVAKKGKVLIGFHERKSRYVAEMSSCSVLPKHVSEMLEPLATLIGGLQVRDQCPQIELSCADQVTALVLRHLAPLEKGDLAQLQAFAQAHDVQWWLQPKGPSSIHLLDPARDQERPLFYSLPAFDLRMYFRPTDFTQVNPFINQALVSRAVSLLSLQPHEVAMDWFCGLGNFTLPMATQAKRVVGVEGSASLIEWARQNQLRNFSHDRKSCGEIDFQTQNLFDMDASKLLAYGVVDKWLVDPPREGAFALIKALADVCQGSTTVAGWAPPQRIVYVSCNPATLARDAGLLVHLAGYECRSAGVVNMFPHTAHVESMAVFERPSFTP
jgi:23S rRNA (uracil1939-C5)-methyltransferase